MSEYSSGRAKRHGRRSRSASGGSGTWRQARSFTPPPVRASRTRSLTGCFQPFVSSKANGMGIGLSISKRIVEAHGGGISVARNDAGRATLPFHAANRWRTAAPMQIDDYVVRRRQMRGAGPQVACFPADHVGFHRAHAQFSHQLPQRRSEPWQRPVYVTDLRMPDVSGVELLARVKDAGAMVPEIVITGHGDVPMALPQ